MVLKLNPGPYFGAVGVHPGMAATGRMMHRHAVKFGPAHGRALIAFNERSYLSPGIQPVRIVKLHSKPSLNTWPRSVDQRTSETGAVSVRVRW